ncbi:MAG: hypothetical protein ACTSYR_00040 [Candidatus Odinarchaeia archaeon]
MKIAKKQILNVIKHEFLTVIILIALGISSLILIRIPTYTITDFKVVYTIFVFLIINGLEKK